MERPEQVERLWWPRLRWRMRGAWQWPAFAVLTVARRRPAARAAVHGRRAGEPVRRRCCWRASRTSSPSRWWRRWPARRLRRRRPDLPQRDRRRLRRARRRWSRSCALVLLGGLLHRPAPLGRARGPRRGGRRRAPATCSPRLRRAPSAWARSTPCASSPTSTAHASPVPTRAAGSACSCSPISSPPGVTRGPRPGARTRPTAGTAASAELEPPVLRSGRMCG